MNTNSISRVNADRIIKFIEESPTPNTTKKIAEILNLTLAQFQSSKPYLNGYKTVGWYWYAHKNLQDAKLRHSGQKILLAKYSYQICKKKVECRKDGEISSLNVSG